MESREAGEPDARHVMAGRPETIFMNNTQGKSWLQLYVDAMMEKDPYKRLRLVRELRDIPRHDDSEQLFDEPTVESAKRKPKTSRRRQHGAGRQQ